MLPHPRPHQRDRESDRLAVLPVCPPPWRFAPPVAQTTGVKITHGCLRFCSQPCSRGRTGTPDSNSGNEVRVYLAANLSRCAAVPCLHEACRILVVAELPGRRRDPPAHGGGQYQRDRCGDMFFLSTGGDDTRYWLLPDWLCVGLLSMAQAFGVDIGGTATKAEELLGQHRNQGRQVRLVTP